MPVTLSLLLEEIAFMLMGCNHTVTALNALLGLSHLIFMDQEEYYAYHYRPVGASVKPQALC